MSALIRLVAAVTDMPAYISANAGALARGAADPSRAALGLARVVAAVGLGAFGFSLALGLSPTALAGQGLPAVPALAAAGCLVAMYASGRAVARAEYNGTLAGSITLWSLVAGFALALL